MPLLLTSKTGKENEMKTNPVKKPKQKTMKAAAIDGFGPPSVLEVATLPVPEAGPGEVLIALHAAGVGVWDTEIRAGWWPAGSPRFPLVLGTDGAGVVVAKGAGVRRFSIGDRVWAYEFVNPKGGFYAEYVSVNAEHAGRVPAGMDLLHAGAAAVTGLTAFQGVTDHLDARKGETVLIFGATGAVGSLAVQFAKLRKVRVIGTASGREAANLVLRLGAGGVIDARSGGAVEQLRQLAPEGVDAVLAFAGGEALERCLDLLRSGGRLAYPNGVEPVPRRRRTFQTITYNGEASGRNFARLARAAAACDLQVPIAAAYPLSQTAKAHERIEKGQVLGRVVLRIRRESA
jgi:NADPH2:quinone reductase